MKKVFSADSLVTVAHYRNLVEAEGIACLVRNENLGAVLGEVPYVEVWPELWVKNDFEAARAEEIIRDAQGSAVDAGPAWHCSGCDEENDYQFAVCWNCGRPQHRP